MVWQIVIQLAIAALFFVVGELLRPKPEFEDAEAVPFGEARIPQVDPQRKQTVIWGRPRFTSPHVMDVAEYETLAIRQRIKTSIFSSTSVTVGYRYLVGMQLGLVSGEATIHKLYYDDETLLWDRDTDPFTDEGDDGLYFDINEPALLGGRENGGGVVGRFRFYPGSSTQNRSTYLQSFQTPSPAYRFTSYLLLELVEVGESPNLDAFSVEISRRPDPLDLAGNGISNSNTAGDINPMSIVADAMTNTDFGFSLSAVANLDLASFRAAATTLAAEGNYMSLKWTNSTSIERIIDNVNKQVDGVLRFNPSSGLWEYKLVRDDYVIGDLKVIDNTNAKMGSFSRANWNETINEVQVNWTDRTIVERPSAAIAHDGSNFRRQGRHKVISLTYPGVYDKTLAANIAARELRGMAFTFSKAELLTNRITYDLLPGDPFVLVWPELGIDQLVMRVGSIGFGDATQQQIQIVAIEDIFALADTLFSLPPDSAFVSPNLPPAQIANQRVIDSPYAFNLNDAGASVPGETNKPLYVATAPNNNSTGLRLHETVGGIDVPEVIGDFTSRGLLTSALTESEGGNTDLIATLELNTVNATGLLNTATVPSTTQKAQLENLAIIISSTINPVTAAVYEPEIISYESASIAGTNVILNNVRRGLLDTLPIAAAADDVVWFLTGDDLPGPTTTVSEYAQTASIVVRAQNITPIGETSISGATQLNLTFRNRVNRPYPPGDFRVEGDRYPTTTFPANSDILFTWSHRNRIVEPLTFQAEASLDQNTTPGANGGAGEEETEYVLRLYNDITDTLVWTVRASTGDDTFDLNNDTGVDYDWLAADQVTAGGPFARVRAELSVVSTTAGPDALLDVVRIFSIVVPINFSRRGAPHFAAVINDTSGLIYPLAETDGAYVDVNGTGTNGSIDGSGIGQNAPGPSPISKAILLPGVNLGSTYVGSVELPDQENFDIMNLTLEGFSHTMMFRVVSDAQTNDKIIWVKDDGLSGNPGLLIGTDNTGNVVVKFAATDKPLNQLVGRVSGFDDGAWHIVTVWHGIISGGNQDFVIFVDGMVAARQSSSGAVNTGTHPVRLGGFSTAGADSHGWAKAAVAEIASDNNPSDPTDVVQMHIESIPWSPFVSTSFGMLQGVWIRGNSGSANGIERATDFSGNFNEMGPELEADPSNGASSLARTVEVTQTNFSVTRDTSFIQGDPWAKSANLGNNGFRISTLMFLDAKTAQGPQSVGYYEAFNLDNLTAEHIMFHFADTTTDSGVSEGENYLAFVNTDGRIHIHIETQDRFANNCRQHRTDDVCVVAGVDTVVHITNRPTTGWQVWVNGVEFSVNSSFLTTEAPASGGTIIPATDTFMNDRRPTETPITAWFDTVIAKKALSDVIPNLTSTTGVLVGRFHEAGFAAKDETWDEDDVIIHYGSGLKGFPTLQDILLDFNPENLMVVDDTAAVDLRGNIITPTPNGTFPTDEEVPLGQDDLVKPQRFNRANLNDLDYTSDHFLSSKGTGILDDFSTVVIGQIKGAGANHCFFANTNAANDFNLYHYWQQSSTSFRFLPQGGTVIVGPDVQQDNPFAIVMTHEDDAGTDRWNFWEDAKRAVAESTSANAYTGGVIDRCRIGNLPAGGQALDGNVPYIGAYARTISARLARRITLKYRGFNGAMLEIHTHIDDAEGNNGFLYPLADQNMSVSGAENWVINDTQIQNLGLTGTHVPIRNAPTLSAPRAAQFASGSYLDSIFNGAGTYPFTMGAWVRVDSGLNAMVAVSNNAVANQYLAVGIINGNAGIRMQVGGAAVEEVGTTSITVGDWAFVAVECISDTDRKLYLNGNLEASFTTSRDVNGQVLAVANTISVNRILGPNTNFNGSYSLFWGVDANLTDAHQAVIYRETQHFGWRGLTNRDGAIAQWLFDEPTDMVTDVYRDQFNDDYNAVPTSTGVTQGVPGILPHAPGICVDFDGTNGGIDTNWSGYGTGTVDRAFECWLEPGFVGTIFSMGANVDAQALVASVDGSGDLSIHIRGAGNQRIWTTSLDTGTTANHLLIQLNGDSLHDFEIFINGVEETTIGTAGTDTLLATVATLDLHVGEDITDLATTDGNGKLYGMTVYDSTNLPFVAGDAALRNSAGRAIPSGVAA